MARGPDGVLTDPYGGKADLDRGVLRHVSPAFCEDPLRVLRVARFAARFASLGFTVHPSTRVLMREITGSEELSHLVPERVWGEIESAMSTGQPGVFVEVLRQCGALSVLLPEVDVLFGVPQPEKYHPEIDTGVHVIMAMNLAARLGWSAGVVFALLLHDLGKGITDPADWPSHVGHERAGVALVERVCKRFRVPGAYRDLALKVCALHLRCHRLMEMQPARVMTLIEDADLLRRPEHLESFIQACEADYRGRKGCEEREYPQARKLAAAVEVSLSIKVKQLDTSGLDGRAIGELLRRSRIEAVSRI
jgi:tRNA nucleotidyltransferase (CCA-adding enzyme)